MEINNVCRDIKVSICCLAYNHEKFIAEAIESFLMQETDFSFEILIGEDHSTDGTLSIVQQYAERFPEKIRLIRDEQNVGAIRNQIRLSRAARGQYLAYCDGDDFWTDPLKLQKQADFLDAHPEYVMCCHYSRVIDESGKTVYQSQELQPLEYSYKDFLLGRREETRIGTMLYRNLKEIVDIRHHDWYYQTHGTDAILKLYITAVTGKKVIVLPEVMSCYRIHPGGLWSLADPKMKKKKTISDFNIIIRNFTYSTELKRELLKLYLKRYFLFELRNRNVHKALRTISDLV